MSQKSHTTGQSTTGRGDQTYNTHGTSIHGQTTASQPRTTRRSGPTVARTGSSALANYVANQSHSDLMMKQYIGDKDRRKEFLDGYREGSRHPKTESVKRDLEVWSRQWDNMTQAQTKNSSKSLTSHASPFNANSVLISSCEAVIQ